ncbi:MAG: phosphatase PAP2 family protein [Chitinophagaceae bacterium]
MKKLLIGLIFILPLTTTLQAQNIDINLLKAINLHRPRSLDNTFLDITNTAKPIAVALPVGMFVTGLIKKDHSLEYNAIQDVGALAITTALTEGLKYTVRRPRPYVTYPFIQHIANDSDPSFPSGHTSIAFATATFLSLNYHQWYIVVPSYLWATAIAYSRMDLGMHYPSDVLAGAIIGAGSAYLSFKAQQWLFKKYKIK